MSRLVAVVVLILTLMIQTIIVSSLPLLAGTADLMLLVLISWALQDRVKTAWEWTIAGGLLVGFVSALPIYLPLIGYTLVTFLARWTQRRVWQTPVLAMLFVTVVGTFLMNVLTILALQFVGTPVSFSDGISLVTLPSTMLNLIFALPVYLLIKDLARWLYPAEDEV